MGDVFDLKSKSKIFPNFEGAYPTLTNFKPEPPDFFTGEFKTDGDHQTIPYIPPQVEMEQSQINPEKYMSKSWSQYGTGILKTSKFVNLSEVPDVVELFDNETGYKAIFKKTGKFERDFGGGSTVEYVTFERTE